MDCQEKIRLKIEKEVQKKKKINPKYRMKSFNNEQVK